VSSKLAGPYLDLVTAIQSPEALDLTMEQMSWIPHGHPSEEKYLKKGVNCIC
jgi:hypothetical protein